MAAGPNVIGNASEVEDSDGPHINIQTEQDIDHEPKNDDDEHIILSD